MAPADAAEEPVEALRAQAARLQEFQEGERARIARQLHDELGGMIAAAKMDMQWLAARLGDALQADSREKLVSVVQLLDRMMRLKRDVVEELRPSLLEFFGLPAALRSHLEEVCRGAGVECVISVPEDMGDLDPQRQLTLLRVVQEASAAMVGRTGARHVELVVEPYTHAGRHGYRLTLCDDAPVTSGDSGNWDIARGRLALFDGWLELSGVAGPGESTVGNRLNVFLPRSAQE